jgi:hypothetical protein
MHSASPPCLRVGLWHSCTGRRPSGTLTTSNPLILSACMHACSQQMTSAITFQRYARGFLARQHARRLRTHRDSMLTFLHQQTLTNEVAIEQRRKCEIERRMHPLSASDFEVLYNELEAWRLMETRQITAADVGEGVRRCALEALLLKVCSCAWQAAGPMFLI